MKSFLILMAGCALFFLTLISLGVEHWAIYLAVGIVWGLISPVVD